MSSSLTLPHFPSKVVEKSLPTLGSLTAESQKYSVNSTNNRYTLPFQLPNVDLTLSSTGQVHTIQPPRPQSPHSPVPPHSPIQSRLHVRSPGYRGARGIAASTARAACSGARTRSCGLFITRLLHPEGKLSAPIHQIWASLMAQGNKESTSSTGELGSIPGLGSSPGGRHGNPLQDSCLENPHGQRSLVGYSPWGRKESNATEQLSTYTKYIQLVKY